MANSTVNLPSRMLMQRLVSCRVVLWALLTHGPRLAEIFNGPLGKSLPAGLQEFLEQLVTQLREVLTAARDLLIERDRSLRDQKSLTTHHRRTRDAAFKQLSPAVAGIRDIIRGAYGPQVPEELGFALRTPVQPAELHEQAEHLTTRLDEPSQKLPAVRFNGVAIDPTILVAEMQPLVEQLGQALEDVGREERQTDAMKIAKDEALQAYDRTFSWVAGSAESLFRLASLPEVAKRVRPSTRRSGVTDEVEQQDPEIPIEDPDATTEDVATEVPAASAKARPDIPPAE